jgi:hypothetical protein
MSHYTMDEVCMTIKGGVLTDLRFGEHNAAFEKTTRAEIMKELLVSVEHGDNRTGARIWSDYHSEEPSTRLFLVLTAHGWKICDDYNTIIDALHTRSNTEFYYVNIDDDCF